MDDIMIYAKDKEGNKISIDETCHGSFAYCQCYCLYCGKPVDAIKNSLPHHFSHNKRKDAVECNRGLK